MKWNEKKNAIRQQLAPKKICVFVIYCIQCTERIHVFTFSPPSSSSSFLHCVYYVCMLLPVLLLLLLLHTIFGRMLAGSPHFFRLSKKFQFCSLITISVNAIMYAYRHIAFNVSKNVTNMCVYDITICFIHIEALLTNKRSLRFGIPKKKPWRRWEKLEEKSNNTEWMVYISICSSFSSSLTLHFLLQFDYIFLFFLNSSLDISFFFHWIECNISYLSVIILGLFVTSQHIHNF